MKNTGNIAVEFIELMNGLASADSNVPQQPVGEDEIVVGRKSRAIMRVVARQVASFELLDLLTGFSVEYLERAKVKQTPTGDNFNRLTVAQVFFVPITLS